MFNPRAHAESIIEEVRRIEAPVQSQSLDDSQFKGLISTFERSYEQAYAKAFTLAIPEGTRFRFIKRVIGKLIRTNTRQQVEFNYQVVELIKLQHSIIELNKELIMELLKDRQ